MFARSDPDGKGMDVTRSINVVTTPEERERAVEARVAASRRVDRLAQGPDGQGRARHLSHADAESGALYGTPDEIAAKLQALRDGGAEYVLLNCAGGRATLRRFARERMPSFAGEAVAANS